MIYLDTSGVMKLVRSELHSADLLRWLGQRPDQQVMSSVLIEVELLRATRRSAPDGVAQAAEVLEGIGIVTMSASVVARAAAYDDPGLRSLDAIHLASAQHVVSSTNEVLDAFIAYDERLLAAARHIGLPVAAPGTDA